MWARFRQRSTVSAVDGTDKVVSLQNRIDGIKRDRTLTSEEKQAKIEEIRKELEKAKAVETKNKEEVSKLIAEAEGYLKEHFDKDYYQAVKTSCDLEKAAAKEKYNKKVEQLKKQHQEILSRAYRSPGKSRTRNTFTKTDCLMRRWIWKKYLSADQRQKT